MLDSHPGEFSQMFNSSETSTKRFTISEELLRNHDTKVRGRKLPYKCPVCGKTFISLSNASDHVEELHKNSYEKKHLCCDCGKGFFTAIQLVGHKYYHHPLEKRKKSKSTEPNCTKKLKKAEHFKFPPQKAQNILEIGSSGTVPTFNQDPEVQAQQATDSPPKLSTRYNHPFVYLAFNNPLYETEPNERESVNDGSILIYRPKHVLEQDLVNNDADNPSSTLMTSADIPTPNTLETQAKPLIEIEDDASEKRNKIKCPKLKCYKKILKAANLQSHLQEAQHSLEMGLSETELILTFRDLGMSKQGTNSAFATPSSTSFKNLPNLEANASNATKPKVSSKIEKVRSIEVPASKTLKRQAKPLKEIEEDGDDYHPSEKRKIPKTPKTNLPKKLKKAANVRSPLQTAQLEIRLSQTEPIPTFRDIGDPKQTTTSAFAPASSTPYNNLEANEINAPKPKVSSKIETVTSIEVPSSKTLERPVKPPMDIDDDDDDEVQYLFTCPRTDSKYSKKTDSIIKPSEIHSDTNERELLDSQENMEQSEELSSNQQDDFKIKASSPEIEKEEIKNEEIEDEEIEDEEIADEEIEDDTQCVPSSPKNLPPKKDSETEQKDDGSSHDSDPNPDRETAEKAVEISSDSDEKSDLPKTEREHINLRQLSFCEMDIEQTDGIIYPKVHSEAKAKELLNSEEKMEQSEVLSHNQQENEPSANENEIQSVFSSVPSSLDNFSPQTSSETEEKGVGNSDESDENSDLSTTNGKHIQLRQLCGTNFDTNTDPVIKSSEIHSDTIEREILDSEEKMEHSEILSNIQQDDMKNKDSAREIENKEIEDEEIEEKEIENEEITDEERKIEHSEVLFNIQQDYKKNKDSAHDIENEEIEDEDIEEEEIDYEEIADEEEKIEHSEVFSNIQQNDMKNTDSAREIENKETEDEEITDEEEKIEHSNIQQAREIEDEDGSEFVSPSVPPSFNNFPPQTNSETEEKEEDQNSDKSEDENSNFPTTKRKGIELCQLFEKDIDTQTHPIINPLVNEKEILISEENMEQSEVLTNNQYDDMRNKVSTPDLVADEEGESVSSSVPSSIENFQTQTDSEIEEDDDASSDDSDSEPPIKVMKHVHLCDICETVFDTRWYLLRHIRRGTCVPRCIPTSVIKYVVRY